MAKILVIGKYYFPFAGGIEENTRVISEALALRHDVVVLCNNHQQGYRYEVINGVTVDRTATLLTMKSQPIGFGTFFKVLTTPADVIHFHAPNPWLSLPLLIRMIVSGNRTPLVITHHMDIYGRPVLRAIARLLYNALLRRSATLIATSLKNITSSADVTTPCTVVPIPLGLDLVRYEISERQCSDARAWGLNLSGGRPIIGFMGRHARYKGLDVLVRAIAADQRLFALIGGDGPYQAETKQLVAELGVADRVCFLGSISHPDKLRLLAAIDVFAFPSTEITEAFGVSQVEAMAMNAPVIATNLPTGVTDVAIADVTALVVPPGDPAALGNAISRLLDDADLRRKLTANAAHMVRTKLVNAKLADETASIIDSFL